MARDQHFTNFSTTENCEDPNNADTQFQSNLCLFSAVEVSFSVAMQSRERFSVAGGKPTDAVTVASLPTGRGCCIVADDFNFWARE